MAAQLKIDFVSDVSCPWCAVGLGALEEALGRLKKDVKADIHIQPFELNPQMKPEGQNATEHIAKKYGMSEKQVDDNRAAMRDRFKTVKLEYNVNNDSRIYNTFDAHRLLHWAGLEGKQVALKHELMKAYFSDRKNPSDHDVLADLAAKAGLDKKRAQEILKSDEFANDVRAAENLYREKGIKMVPTIIINDNHVISGAFPADDFEKTLREIIAD